MTREEAQRVRIFDTTLRDGEQSPGISLNRQEKVEIASQLARLGVDIIEAGFPITSPGDFDAVQAIAREVEGPVICGLARTAVADIDAAWNAIKDSERPRIHTFIATSDIHIERKLQTTREDVKGQASAAVAHARSYTDDVEFSPEDGSRSDVEFMAEVIQIALDEGATTINVPDTVGYTMPDEYRAMFEQLYRLVPGLADVTRLRALPRRPRPGRRQLVRRPGGGCRQVECAINGIGERAGNASLEEIVMLLAHARVDRRSVDRRSDRGDRAHQPARVPPDRLPSAAEQGDRRPQRVRARGGHPPGRRAEGAHHLRDHGRHHDRPGDELDRARQALRPPRPAKGPGGARLRCRGRRTEHGVQALQGGRRPQEDSHRARPGGDRLRRDAPVGQHARARVVRHRGRLRPLALRPRAGADARRRARGGQLHRRRPGRCLLQRHQRRHRA